MQEGYWAAVRRRRISRRRALTTGGGFALGLGALSLIGCGDDGSPEGQATGGQPTGGQPTSGQSTGSQATGSQSTGGQATGGQTADLLSTPVDSTEQATQGGILDMPRDRELISFDFDGPLAEKTSVILAYSRLTRYKTFKYPDEILAAPDADAATAWEVSPDGLTYSYKLRPDTKFDPRPPTNGRVMTSADYLYSAGRYAGSPLAGQWLKDIAPAAPVTSFEAPDASTVVINLAFPYALTPLMTAGQDFVLFMPTEAEDQFDPKADMRGTGPWRTSEISGSGIKWEKNGDWYDASAVHLDGLNEVIMLEYSARMAQLRAGTFATIEMIAEDILQTKSDVSSLLMLVKSPPFFHESQSIKFSQLPDSPFRDARVRQAVSMLMDRDLLIETMFNVPTFRDAGLEAEIRWDSAVLCDSEFWLDPQSTAFGENAKYLHYDPQGAKQLLSAAGHDGPISQPFIMSGGHPSDRIQRGEAIIGMLEANGDFQIEERVVDHSLEYRPQINYGLNEHEGLGWSGGQESSPDPDLFFERWYRSTSSLTNWTEDPLMDELLDKQRRESDPEERKKIIHDIQRHAAVEMRNLWPLGASQSYELVHPWLGNYGVWRTRGVIGETYPTLWIDQSKR